MVFPHAGGAARPTARLAPRWRPAAPTPTSCSTRSAGIGSPIPPRRPSASWPRELFDAGDWARLGPLRLFGHCMGAVVAFEFARVAEAPRCRVRQLWVSASEAPSTVAASPSLPTAEAEIIAEMVDLGGTDPQLLADEDFVELLLLAVRADYQAFNRYSCDADVTHPRRHPHRRRPRRPSGDARTCCAAGKPTPTGRSRCRCSTAATSTSTIRSMRRGADQ